MAIMRLKAKTAFIILGMTILLSLSRSVNAGQRAKAPQSDDKFSKMSVEELRAYQGYYFTSGGRDPMSMRLPTESELGLDVKKGEEMITLAQMEQRMEEALENVTNEVKAHRYVEAIKISEDILYKIDNEWPAIKPDQLNLRRMDEELRSLNRMAVRLKTQQDITIEFEALHLRVDGVIWSPSDAKAVVNGTLFAAGEVMLNERKQGDLRIEVIEEHGVVFQFKGMRFRLPVEIYAPMIQSSGRK